MLWIPIIFVCFETCVFVPGQPEYTERACLNTLQAALERAQSAQAVAGVCIPVNPV